jgi:phosphotransferase system HPr (HPr) family protein
VKTTARAKVASTDGIHARPCAAIALRLKKSKCRARLTCGPHEADGSSVLALMGLEAERGAEIVVEVDGPDSAAVAADIVRILEDPRVQG